MPGLATRAQFRRHAIGFDAVFCEEPFPLPGGTLCILRVVQADELFRPRCSKSFAAAKPCRVSRLETGLTTHSREHLCLENGDDRYTVTR